ncbi:hypothetical protein [Clostridium sp. JS66]|nr:hypothetical protein [Clostridium sp. JS66]WPC40870.1 hypothetical protein Q6H37_23700 [Clostridium sp. JS66]
MCNGLADDATILYDCSTAKELHVEDLAGLCSIAVDELVRNAESTL